MKDRKIPRRTRETPGNTPRNAHRQAQRSESAVSQARRTVLDEPGARREDARRSRREAWRRHYLEMHWRRLLLIQGVAYAALALLWLLPLPNPVKLLVVSFHEISHALAAILTGGRVFGYAISPGGGGVTMGIGGNLPLVLVAGYFGSCLCGALLYWLSVNFKAGQALVGLLMLMVGTTLFGWLNEYTALFGFLAFIVAAILIWAPAGIQVLFVQLVGSACCLYAPLDLLGDLAEVGASPSVGGVKTASDVSQLADLTGLPIGGLTAALFLAQVALLVCLIRWSCRTGAQNALRNKLERYNERTSLVREIRSLDKPHIVYVKNHDS